MTPPDVGDGLADVTVGNESARLAQGASAFAVDANGNVTTDPSAASYFALQIYQYVSPSRMELFELRVTAPEWAQGDVSVDGQNAVGLYGRIDFDANDNVAEANVIVHTAGGTLHVDAAGKSPGDAVSARFDALPLSDD